MVVTGGPRQTLGLHPHVFGTCKSVTRRIGVRLRLDDSAQGIR